MKEFTAYEEMLDAKQYNALRNHLLEEEPADIAQLIENIPPEKAVLIFRMLPKDIAAAVFAELYSDVQKSLIGLFSDTEINQILEELFLDDAADFIEEMPATIAKKVLANAKSETRDEINRLLKYPENSAGSIMTVEYVDLKRSMTVREAFERIRKTGTDKETIYTCYVTDSQRRLEGVVTAKDLMLAVRHEEIGDIMDTSIMYAGTHEDREEVARRFNKYDLLSMPVVDLENRLVGIITVDDIADVIQAEATEDFEKMAAILPSYKPYLKTNILRLAWNRLPWLIVLMLAAMFTETIISSYEHALEILPILAGFIPLLMDTGGNSGSQSSTLIIRGMALFEIKKRDFFKVMFKEMRVGFLVGLGLSTINFIRVWITYTYIRPNEGANIIRVSATVSLTLLFTVIAANLIGGMLPIAAKKCGIDPAVMAAPLITTIVDVMALLVFFALAMLLLF